METSEKIDKPQKTKKSSNVIIDVNSSFRDELINSIAVDINKANKNLDQVIYFLDQQENPALIPDWVSTGSSLLDVAISNQRNGGLPVSRIIEIYGDTSSGKSLLLAHILANTQKKGGIGIMFDTESAAAPSFWTAIGVDIKNLMYIPEKSIERIFEYIEMLIAKIRKADKNRLVTIVVDSIAGASTIRSLESDFTKKGFNTDKALILSEALQKISNMIARERVLIIFTNQIRFKMDAMAFGDRWTTPGGKAIPFYSSVRIKLATVKKIKSTDKEIIGNRCKAIVVKNRIGPPFRNAEFNVLFDSGIQDLSSWYDLVKEYGLDEEIKSSSKFVEKINTDPTYKEEIYNKITDRMIMKYKAANSKIDENVIMEDEVSGEDDEVDKLTEE